MPNMNSLTRRKEGIAVKAFFSSKALGMPDSEIAKILSNVPLKLLPKLIKSLEYLDKNNCLSRHSFEELSIRKRKHNFSLPTAYLLIRELDRQGILNQRNFEMIFKSENPYNERVVWRHLMPGLIKIGFINQNNLDKLFLHNDFEGLMSSLTLVVDHASLHSTIYIDKLIAQNELRNFKFIASFVPDAVWLSDKKTAKIFNKLLQCNASIGNRMIEENKGKIDYRYLKKTVVHKLLNRCIEAVSSEDAVKLLAKQPRAYSAKEIFIEDRFREMLGASNVNRIARSVDSSLAVGLVTSESSVKKEISGQSASVGVIQRYPGSDTLLFGIYGIASVLQYFGLKNISLANTQPTVNESAVDFKGKQINHIVEQMSAAEKKYEGNSFAII